VRCKGCGAPRTPSQCDYCGDGKAYAKTPAPKPQYAQRGRAVDDLARWGLLTAGAQYAWSFQQALAQHERLYSEHLGSYDSFYGASRG
jgi:hypothetical protein